MGNNRNRLICLWYGRYRYLTVYKNLKRQKTGRNYPENRYHQHFSNLPHQKNYFNKTADPHSLRMPPARLELRRNFFSLRVIEKWNSLPTEVKSSKWPTENLSLSKMVAAWRPIKRTGRDLESNRSPRDPNWVDGNHHTSTIT